MSLRLPATSPCQPARARASAMARAAVATPLARVRMFSAVRSPSSTAHAGPRTVAARAGGASTAPSCASHATLHPRCSNTAVKKGAPASTAPPTAAPAAPSGAPLNSRCASTGSLPTT